MYRTQGGISVNEYQARVLSIVKTNQYLKKYLKNVNKAFEEAEPYLKKYPKESPIGFVGYIKERQ